jgi:NitT/TauT family transport system permease protein
MTDVTTGHRVRPFSKWLVFLLQVVVVAVVIACWQLTSGHLLPTIAVSKPALVARALYHFLTSQAGWNDTRVTLQEMLIGYVLGVIAGLVLGIGLALNDLLARVVGPLVAAINGVPTITLAPLFILFLGLGIKSKIALAALGVFFVMFYTSFAAYRTVDRGLMDTVHLFGAKRRTIVRSVILPAMSPSLFSALRVGYFFAMGGAIIGEFLAAQNGLGYYINQQAQVLNTPNTYAGMMVLLILSLIGNWLFRGLYRHLFRWYEVRR